MTYTVILLVPRKPGLFPVEFKHHSETIHVPLLKLLVGYDFPLFHTTHYIERASSSPSTSPDAQAHRPVATKQAVPTIGDVDGIAVLTFANKKHFGRFKGKLADEMKRRMYESDLEAFVDVSALKYVIALLAQGETRATGSDGGMVGWRFVGSV